MNTKRVARKIEDDFIQEFIFRIIKSQDLINKSKQKKVANILTENLPATGQKFTPVAIVENQRKTPELLKSIIQEDTIEQKTIAPRQLIAPPKTPLASYIPHNIQIPSISSKSQINELVNLDKLRNILTDYSVNVVECPGAGKPLIITRRGIVSQSSITLTEEEINEFMKNVSQKTRIPLITGLFKALLGNFVIIAVISELVGTRFVIQRR